MLSILPAQAIAELTNIAKLDRISVISSLSCIIWSYSNKFLLLFKVSKKTKKPQEVKTTFANSYNDYINSHQIEKLYFYFCTGKQIILIVYDFL